MIQVEDMPNWTVGTTVRPAIDTEVLGSETMVIERQMDGKIVSVLVIMEIPAVTKIRIIALEMNQAEGKLRTRAMMEVKMRQPMIKEVVFLVITMAKKSNKL